MGNIRRIGRKLQPKMALASTGISVNGCTVFLGHINPKHATTVSGSFKTMFTKALHRSACPNLHDIYSASFSILDDVKNCRPLGMLN